ncbi:putative heme oxygenase [Lyophyllum shimeji]|uniref:Heme oxygenase n=1 Tax=Lyophyllum shimeji TaxID=47721 RepID=A0A9P3PMH2_LYOSH|nr:putative heme oxygenase [Lyophyllum shimeji]
MSIDFSLPLATLLREATHEAHEIVAKSPGATAMLSGRLDREEYVRYLMMLWHIYDAFEQALDRHATHPVLEPTYNPTLLARAPALASDISFLLQVPEASWKTHSAHTKLVQSPPPELTAYIARIRELAESEDPTRLLAHSYVRYLGDLSGGQTVRRTLGKAYDLDDDVGQGLSFYAFKELRSAKTANQGEMKRIKEWFRAGMNTAGERGEDVKAAVLDEANKAFALNTALFMTIRTDPPSQHAEAAMEVSKEIPIIVEQGPQEKSYPLSQIIVLVAAACLAHFILVTGGFTGDQGYQKLLAVERWFSTLWGSVPRPE